MRNSKLSSRFKLHSSPAFELCSTDSGLQAENFDDFQTEILTNLTNKVTSIPVWDEYTDDEKRQLISIYVDNKSKENSKNEVQSLKDYLFSVFNVSPKS